MLRWFQFLSIIVDTVTHYIGICLTTSKSAPIYTVQRILNKFKSIHTRRTVHIEQCGVLRKSSKIDKTRKRIP